MQIYIVAFKSHLSEERERKKKGSPIITNKYNAGHWRVISRGSKTDATSRRIRAGGREGDYARRWEYNYGRDR